MLTCADDERRLLVDPVRTLDAEGKPAAELRAAFAIEQRPEIVMPNSDSLELPGERRARELCPAEMPARLE